ncbi:MAG: class I SAM-dependent methyltransferase [Terriglobales bacterium]
MPEATADRAELVAALAVCPDDGSQLEKAGASLSCSHCGRGFVGAESIWDLRPSQTFEDVTEHYQSEYLQLAHCCSADRHSSAPWGAPEAISPKQLMRKQRHISAVQSLLRGPHSGEKEGVLCDFSGGSGYYTLAFAPLFKTVVHCDLDPASLSYTAARAGAQGLTNMLFLRIDYLKPPFAGSLDCVICLDTLIRGRTHERSLLNAIRGALKPGGCAVIDFHNWWHNPLRRLGLLHQNFGTNTSYSLREVVELLASADFHTEQYLGFRQENLPKALLSLVPPTRFLFRVAKKV